MDSCDSVMLRFLADMCCCTDEVGSYMSEPTELTLLHKKMRTMSALLHHEAKCQKTRMPCYAAATKCFTSSGECPGSRRLKWIRIASTQAPRAGNRVIATVQGCAPVSTTAVSAL